jgi:hypothetical protein
MALGFSNRGSSSGFTSKRLILGAIALAAIFSLQFALYRIQERFSDPLQDARLAFLHTTSEAARAYMPVGSGIGTFVPVYAMFEKPNDVGEVYINHAHNDILEVWLEAGVAGIALMALFLFLLIRRSLDLWRGPPVHGANALDWSLARAATIIIPLVAIHSFFDYPLRTGAMMAIMAFSCALLIEPPYSHRTEELELQLGPTMPLRPVRREPSPVPALQRLKPKTQAQPTDAPSSVPPAPSPVASPTQQRLTPQTQAQSTNVPSSVPRRRWGVGMQWPKEWSKPSSQSAPNGVGKLTGPSKPRDH